MFEHLIAQIRASPPQEVPELLATTIPGMIPDDVATLAEELRVGDQADSPSVLIAMNWVRWFRVYNHFDEACFVPRQQPPVMTALGRSLLKGVSLGTVVSLDSDLAALDRALGGWAQLTRDWGTDDTLVTSDLSWHLGFTATQALDHLADLSQRFTFQIMTFADALQRHFERTDELPSLTRALTLYERASAVCPAGSVEQAICSAVWASALLKHHQVTRLPDSLARARSLCQQAQRQPGTIEAANLAPVDMYWAHAFVALFAATGESTWLLTALDRYTQALEHIGAGSTLEPSCQTGLATVLRMHFELTGNLPSLDQALRLYESALPRLRSGSAEHVLCQIDQAAALLRRFEMSNEQRALLRAISLYEDAERDVPAGSRRHTLCLINRANALIRYVWMRDGMADQSTSLTRALELYRQAAVECVNDVSLLALCHMNWAVAIETQSLVEKDSQNLKRAIDLYRQAAVALVSTPVAQAMCQLSLAIALHHLSEMEPGPDYLTEALGLYEQALHAFPEGSLILTTCRINWAHALKRHSEVTADRESLMLAYHHLQDELHHFESALVAMPTTEYQQHAFTRSPHDLLVAVCLALLNADAIDHNDYLREAWETAERSRAQFTRQRIVGQVNAVEQLSDPPLALAQQLVALDQAWLALMETAESVVPEIHRPVVAERRIAETRQTAAEANRTERAQVAVQLAALDPRLDRLLQVHQPDLATVQTALDQLTRTYPASHILLQSHLLDDELILFRITADTLDVTRLPLSEDELRLQTDRFLTPLSRGDLSSANDALMTSLAWLGDRLSPTLHRWLPAPTPTNEVADRPAAVPLVCWVPSGPLHLWPLSALPLGNERVLLDRAAVVTLPSADSLTLLTPGPEVEPLTGLHAFAPPTDLRFTTPQAYYCAHRFDQLTKLPARVHQDDASLSTLERLRHAATVFATHGQVVLSASGRREQADVAFSGLLLADPEAPGQTTWVDALVFQLSLRELQSPLLIASACEVSGTLPGPGENLTGLGEVLLGASRRVVSSLWAIDDAATLCLMVPFWNGIARGLTVPQALRAAQLALRKATLLDVKHWGQAIMATLPKEEQQSFWDAWLMHFTAVRQLPDAVLARMRPGFDSAAIWAPYVALGWPGPWQFGSTSNSDTGREPAP